jgi:hypothetical protein
MLALMVVLLFLLGGMAVAFLSMTTSGHGEIRSNSRSMQAMYLADAAVQEAVAVLEEGGRDALEDKVYPAEFGGSTYDLEVVWGEDDATMDDDIVRLIGTGTQGNESVSVEVLLRVGVASDDDTVYGIVGKSKLTFLSNAVIDSYDSSLGTYASQALYTWNGWPYAKSNAPVSCSTGSISLDSNSSIRGDAHPGVGKSVSISGGSIITGSTTPLLAPIPLPPPVVPSFPSSGSISKSSGSLTIPPGDRRYTSFTADSVATITIQGPANIVIGDVRIDSNAKVRIDSTGGPVVIYVTGKYEQLSNAVVGPINGNPKDLMLIISGNSPDALIDSNPTFTGILYAPDRKLLIKSNAQIFGSLVGKEITLDSNAKLHFDEHLLAPKPGAGGGPLEVLCWRPIQAQSSY